MTTLLWTAALISSFSAASFTEGPRSLRIEWQPDTLTLIQAGGGYGRVIRLTSDELLACYVRRAYACVKHSSDNGKTWSDQTQAVAYAEGAADNPELLLLSDGRVMLMINERNRSNPRHNGIAVAFSSDNGRTWSPSERIYTGKCWEPAAIEHPETQSLQILFADEEPYQKLGRSDQNISVMTSADNGRTWKGPAIVSYRPNHRDGMPVPLKLQNGGLVVAIEDPGLHGNFKPVILDVSRAAGTPIGPDSPHRWSALAEPLPPDTYAGAPYIVQMPSGQTLLSYRCKPKDALRHTMIVAVGDNEAKQFQNPSAPFAMGDENGSQDWSSLFVKDPNTVTAVSGATINGVRGIWTIDGRLISLPVSPAPGRS